MFRVVFYLLAFSLACLQCSNASGNVGTTEGPSTYPSCRKKLSSCSCFTDQGLVNLKPLDSKNSSSPSFTDIENPSNADAYFFNPCTPFSIASCLNVSACQSFGNSNRRSFWSFGEHATAEFQNHPKTHQLTIKYSTSDLPIRTTTVILDCNRTQHRGVLSFVAESPENNAIFVLTSTHACPRSTHYGKDNDWTTESLLMWFAALCVLLLTLLAITIAAVHCVRALSATKSDSAPLRKQQPAAYSTPDSVWSTEILSNEFKKNKF